MRNFYSSDFSLDKFNPFEDSELSEAEICSLYSNSKKIFGKHLPKYIKPLLLGYNTFIQANSLNYAVLCQIALSKVIPSILQPQAFIIYPNESLSGLPHWCDLIGQKNDDIEFKILGENEIFQKLTSHIIVLSGQLFLALLKIHPLFKYVKICIFVQGIHSNKDQLHEMFYQLPQNI